MTATDDQPDAATHAARTAADSREREAREQRTKAIAAALVRAVFDVPDAVLPPRVAELKAELLGS